MRLKAKRKGIISLTSATGSVKIDVKDGDSKKKPPKPSISAIIQLYSYADAKDIWCMVIGTISAMSVGIVVPLVSTLFGRLTDLILVQQKYVTDPRYHSNVTTKYSSTPSNPPSPELPSDFITDRDFLEQTGYLVYYYLLAASLCFILAMVAVFCWDYSCENQTTKLKKVYLSQILRQDATWFDECQDGDMANKLTDDLERMRVGLGSKVPIIIQALAVFFTGILVGFHTNWKMTLVILSTGPIFITSSFYTSKLTAGTAQREQLRYGVAGGIASELLNSIRTVAAFGGEQQGIERYDEALDIGRKLAMKKYYALSFGMGFTFGFTYIIYALGVWYGTYLYLAGEVTPGSVFTIFGSVVLGAFGIGNTLPIMAEISAAVGAGANVFEVIRRIPKIDPYAKGGIILSNVEGRIEFQQVHFYYSTRPDVKVLKGLDMKIPPGMVVGVVGSSGAGKSTLVSLIMRLYEPTIGKIYLDGVRISELNVSWLRSQIGIVSQEPILFNVTIEENIRYGRADVSKEEIIEAAMAANAHSFIEELPDGYNTVVGERGTQISGGQKQRIAIARALVRNPRILLLDEATSALDSQSEKVVQDALDNAMRGRTTIVIAHRLSTVRNADLIYAMKDGTVIESGTHETLMQIKGLYYNLVTAQEKKVDIPPVDEVMYEQAQLKLRKRSSARRLSRKWSSAKVISLEVYPDNDKENEDAECEEKILSFFELIKLNKKQWPLMGVAVIALILTGMHMPIFSLLYGQMLQIYLSPRSVMSQVSLFWSGMFLILALVTAVAFYISALTTSSITERLIQHIRLLIFRSFLTQQVAWFDEEEYSPIKLANCLSRDPPLVKMIAGMRGGQIILGSVTLIMSLSIAFYYSWKLALILFAFVPVLIVASWKQTRIRFKAYLSGQSADDSSSKIASEGIQNNKTVQYLGLQNHLVMEYSKELDITQKSAFKQALMFSFVFAAAQSVPFFMFVCTCKFGPIYLNAGEIEPKSMYIVIFTLSLCSTLIGSTMTFFQDLGKGKVAMTYLYKLMNIKSHLNVFEHQGLTPEIKGKIELRGVEFAYPIRKYIPILRGVNLTIEAGQTVALVGGSGCGKSTIIGLLERFYCPDKGHIFIDDVEISKIKLSYLRSRIGLVTQEPSLFDCSIRENIAYGALSLGKTVTDQEVIAAAKSANIHDFIVSLPQGYDTLAGDRGAKLSGGQKQRIAIARALIRDPKILLLDEATSALDNESEKVVQEALDKARLGRTSIVVAHRLSTVQNADLIVVIHQGKVVEKGTHTYLKSLKGRYYDLIMNQ